MTTLSIFFFFFNDSPTTEIYTLSLHDALPISDGRRREVGTSGSAETPRTGRTSPHFIGRQSREPASLIRSEEHTSELQSLTNLVCRLLLEKKKKKKKKLKTHIITYTTNNIHQR